MTTDDVAAAFGCGPDAGAHVAAARPFVDAGFDHLVLVNAVPTSTGSSSTSPTPSVPSGAPCRDGSPAATAAALVDDFDPDGVQAYRIG